MFETVLLDIRSQRFNSLANLLDFKRLIYCVDQTFYLSLQKFVRYDVRVGYELQVKALPSQGRDVTLFYSPIF
ncbi:Uncharacterised protein [Chlamydia trachomatis]|nr:Uncharacterised protein [Chlamydia trachomatis]